MSDGPKTSDEKTLEELFPGYEVDRDALAPAYKALRIKLGIGQFYMRHRDAPKIGFFTGLPPTHKNGNKDLPTYMSSNPIHIETFKPGVELSIDLQGEFLTWLQASGFCIDVQLDDDYLDRRLYIKAKPKEEEPFCRRFLRQEPVIDLLRRFIPPEAPDAGVAAFFHLKDQHLFFTVHAVRKGGGKVALWKAQRIARYLHEFVTTLDNLPLQKYPLVWPENPAPWFRSQYPDLKRWTLPGRSTASPSGSPVAVCYSNVGEIEIEE